MSEAPIPFGNDQQSGQEELAGASPVAINIITDSRGAVMQRPGLGAYSLGPSAAYGSLISGLYATVGGKLYAVGGSAPNRPVLIVNPSGFDDLSYVETSDGYLGGTGRPVFAEAQLFLAIAAGGPTQKVVFGSPDVSAPLGGGPPEGTSVVANASRLLIDNPAVSGQVAFSDVFTGGDTYAGAETWTPALGNTAGEFNAAARPDPVVAVRDNTNEVFVFGATTLQVWDPDPTVVYAPIATREVGCVAGASVIKVDQNFAWLDDKRRFVVSDGRTFQVISDQIQQTLSDLGTVNDCFGFRFYEGSADAMVWVFPTDGRTFVYQTGHGWAEWLSWSDTANTFAPFEVTAHHLRADLYANVVAATGTGYIRLLSRNFSSDLLGATTRIPATVTTGFQDRGSLARKRSNAVRLALRRGKTGNDQAGRLWWRDDLGAWEGGLPFNLGAAGDYETVVPFNSVGGVYRKRQWKFEFSGTDSFVLASATEDFTVLGN